MATRPQSHLVAVDMGYGHERAAYALRDLSGGAITIANNYDGIPEHDRTIWQQGRTYYETISRMQPLPVIGKAIFETFVDQFQEIDPFYPRRDFSKPSLQLRQVWYSVTKQGIGRHLVDQLRKVRPNDPLPFVTTFFLPAFAAEYYDYPGDIYVVACDADIARVWAPLNPKKSRIKYFAPNGRVLERLRLYGVRREQIYLTGFPLPKELIGGPRAEIVKHDLGTRLAVLDPNKYLRSRYHATFGRHFGRHFHDGAVRPPTITFAVGGAGAQKRLAVDLAKSIRGRLRRDELRLQLVAGTRRDVLRYFTQQLRAIGLGDAIGKSVRILFAANRPEYFSAFSQAMRETDILWTKPSELSFYTGLGIPIIMAEPIGSQEHFNREWLRQVGGGVDQLDPRHADEWLWDWIQSGALARMAWSGYIEAPTHGTYRIEAIIRGEKAELETLPLVV
ncbi:hypothetical protein HY632_02385 [Candidatus Uhrbacteria bacterium]|nr:hypothetical protein [Candidatus Uhrbacteria bacterium]